METDTAEKTARNNYDFLDNKAKEKKYFQIHIEKMQKRSPNYDRNIS